MCDGDVAAVLVEEDTGGSEEDLGVWWLTRRWFNRWR